MRAPALGLGAVSEPGPDATDTMPRGNNNPTSSSFIGFGSFASLSPSSSGSSAAAAAFEPFPASADPELAIALGKACKKDETTKLKGLADLSSLIRDGGREKAVLARMLGAWCVRLVSGR